MNKLQTIAGFVAKITQEMLEPGDAFFLIVVRNTPKIDAGSDQAMATNCPEQAVEVLRWMADDFERNAGKSPGFAAEDT